MNPKDSEADQWNERYTGGRPPWDLGEPPPALLDLIASLPADRMHVLVPCAGYGHDAIAWGEAGHEVVAVDFARLAAEGARAGARAKGVNMEVLQADLFNLEPAYAAAFDIVWEQTCLAALDPDRREAYFSAMARALKPGGEFHGLLWSHGRAGGPPYNITIDMIERLTAGDFNLVEWRWLDPATARRKGEFLVRLQKRRA